MREPRADLGRLCPGLELGSEGIWSARGSPAVSYPEGGHSACFAVEDGSFWFQHRNRCIAALVRAYPPAQGWLLDVGGGNGVVAKCLQDDGVDVALIEPGPQGAANARKRGLRHVACATVEAARVPAASMGAVGLFDVIEHIADDAAFVRSMHNVLQPGGRLYLTVPAYSWLWSQADVEAGHQRRYDLAAISSLVTRNGFSIDYASYFFRPLPVPVLLARALPHRLGLRRPPAVARVRADHAVGSDGLAGLLGRVLHPEVSFIERGVPMRFGGSCIVAASAR